MVFWTFVQKTKKTVFEADEKLKTKNHKKPIQKAKSQPKNQVKKKWFFANPGHRIASTKILSATIYS
jgi:hypothetical protein